MLENVAIQPLLAALELPQTLQDDLSLAAKRQWQGSARVQASDRVSSDQSGDQGIRWLDGVLRVADLQGKGDRLQLQSAGEVNMPQHQLDVAVGLKLSGWQGDEQLVSLLSQQAIPLRIYGSWDNVQYSLPVDQVLRQQLQSEAKSRLNEWLDRQPKNNESDSLRKLLRP
nr:outer membrane assembly protein AsmA [Candidatus Pantoea persica]